MSEPSLRPVEVAPPKETASKTVSIRQTLAVLPGGREGTPLTWQETAQHLRENYLKNDRELLRIAKFQKRQRLYLGSSESDTEAMIEKVFKNDAVKKKQHEWVSFAKYNNVIRRLIIEQASVYSLPAERTVGIVPERDPDADQTQEDPQYDAKVEAFNEQNRRYQEVLRLCRFHEVMQRLNALLLLNRSVVVRPRMRKQPDGKWVPTIDLITPANFHAVRDPIDQTLCVALIFLTAFQLAKGVKGPTWELLTWHERAWFNEAGAIMETNTDGSSAIEEHNLDRIPAILATIEPPDGCLIDESTGEDLVAGQESVTFLMVRMLKEAKSATSSTVLQGDLSAATRGQGDDSEIPKSVPEGVTATTLDQGMDFLKFDDCAMRVTRSLGANHGVSMDEMNQATPSSAEGLNLRRIPLSERRQRQHVPFRQIEGDIVELLAVMVAQRRPDLAFTTEGFNVDFADPQTPLGSSEALDVLAKELKLGLTSELRAIMDRNPDLTYEQAKQILLQLIEDRTFRIEAMKQFMVASGGLAQGGMPEDAPGDGSITKRTPEDDRAQEAA